MSFIITGIFIVLPFLGVIVASFAYFSKHSKNSMVYSLLMALFMGIIAYHFIPLQSYDLYRHHQIYNSLVGADFKTFLAYLDMVDLEVLPMLVNFLLAKFQNMNLLQFSVITAGYFLLFYMLHDYRKKININTITFIGIFCFTLFGFNVLNFFSGLWNYIAIIIFSFAAYLDYIKNTNKILPYLLYTLSFFFHSSMIFPLAILLIYKFFKNKFNLKTVVITVTIFLIPSVVLSFVNNLIEISLLKEIEYTFNSYFLKNSIMHNFYGSGTIMIELMKLSVTVIAIFLQKEREKVSGLNGFILLLSICTLIMMPKSIVMIRFIMLVQFMGIIPLIDTFKNLTKKNLLCLLGLYIITAIFGYYFFFLLSNQNFGDLFSEKIFSNLFNLITK